MDVSARESWHALAERPADVEDQMASDLDRESEPVEHVKTVVTRVFARTKSI